MKTLFKYLLTLLLTVFTLTAGAENYPLWLGSTQVTDENKDNILNQVDANGNPTAKYNPSTETLTLNNPTITGSSHHAKIYCYMLDSITGSYHMSENDQALYGLYISRGGSVIKGDFTFYGSDCGVVAQEMAYLYIKSGSLKAIGWDYGLQCDQLLLTSAGVNIELKGNEKAYDCQKTPYLANNALLLTTPEGGCFDYGNNQFYEADGTTIAMHVIFTVSDSYPIWLGETIVTPANQDNILNQTDADGNPTAKYDPSTNTLTLNNPTITSVHTFGKNNETAVIYSDNYSLVLEGTYHQTTATAQYGIRCTSSLFYLGGDFTFRGTDYGIYADKRCDLLINMYTDLSLSGGTGAMYCPIYYQDNYLTKYVIYDSQGGRLHYASPYFCDKDGNIAKDAEIFRWNDLWLGSTEVLPENCDDILGDGKASYNPATQTLTLNNPTIPGYDYVVTINGRPSGGENKIYADRIDLTIKGSYHMAMEEIQHGIFVHYGSLTLDGDFTFNGKLSAVSASDVTVKSGSLTAVGMSDLGGGYGISGNSLTVGAGVTYVELQGGTYPLNLNGGGLHLAEGYAITTPENGIFQNNVIYHSDGTTLAKNVVIQDATTPVQFYDLWVGSTHVSDTNQDDIFGDGKASFNATTNTLTLQGIPTIVGTTNNSKIYSMLPSLTITGSYHMTEAETKNGIYSEGGPLTLDGDFTFLSKGDWLTDVNGVSSLNTGNTLWVTGNITLNGNITVQGQDVASSAIYTESGNISVLGGNLQASSNNKCAAYCGGTFTAKGSTESITLEGTPGAIHAGNLVIDNATGEQLGYYEPENAYFSEENKSVYGMDGNTGILATRVVLRQPKAYKLWLGSTQVNETNCDNILGDGKAKYNPVTGILTLDNPTISGHYRSNGYECKIASQDMDLTLKGVYRMEAVDNDAVVGLSVSGGTLTTEGDFTFQGLSVGVDVTDNMSVKGRLRAIGSQFAGLRYSGTDTGKGLTLLPGFIGETKVELDGGLHANSYTDVAYHIGQQGLVLAEPDGGSINYYYRIQDGSGNDATHAVLTLKGTASGQGTEQNPYWIYSKEDWAAACADVANGVDLSGKIVGLYNDITVRKMMGTELNPFNGTFNGYGSTLTVNINENVQGAAPFHTVSGATIKNLKVAGTVKGQSYNAGIVGYVKGDGNLIENCEVIAGIAAMGGYNGGFVGHAGNYATTLQDCVFRGGLYGLSSYSILNNATFVGWDETGAQLTLNRCMDLTQSDPIGRGQVEPTTATNIYSSYNKSSITGNNAWENTVPHLAYSVTGADATLTLTGATGMAWDNAIYAAQGETIAFTVDPSYVTYVSTAGTFSQDQENCTLVMPAENVSIMNQNAMAYAITGNFSTGGTVDINKTEATAGMRVCVTITRDPHYLLDELTVKDEQNNEIAMTMYEEGFGYFIMPSGPVTVTVTFNKQYSFDATTGELRLLLGDFNTLGNNAFGSDVTDNRGAVLKVTAADGVRFIGVCSSMFLNFSNCTEIDLSNVNTAAMTYTTSMFAGCTSLRKLNMTGWNLQQVEHMSEMFKNCSSLREIDLSGININTSASMTEMFTCSGTNTGVCKLTLPAGFGVTASMFLNKGYYSGYYNGEYHNSGWQLLGDKTVVSGTDQYNDQNGSTWTWATLPAQPTTATFVWSKMPEDFVLELPDGQDNSATVEAWDGVTTNVQLTGRKLWKDGKWNTICLPFKFIDYEDFGSDVVIQRLDILGYFDNDGNWGGEDKDETNGYIYQTGFDETTGTLRLYFEDSYQTEAGRPYLIKWANDTEHPYTENPTFTGVTIDTSTYALVSKTVTSTDGTVSFIGTYDSRTFDATDQSILFMGADNTLYYPASGAYINAFRAYFQLTDGNANVKSFVLNFGDNDVTAIHKAEISNFNSQISNVYDLQGRKISNFKSQISNLPKGIYIHNGKKVLIK